MRGLEKDHHGIWIYSRLDCADTAHDRSTFCIVTVRSTVYVAVNLFNYSLEYEFKNTLLDVVWQDE